MSIERLDHPAIKLLCGNGLDLPGQAARTRAICLPGREGRPPVLVVALLWVRECPDVVRTLEAYLDGLLADCTCTPSSWSEAQAARQVLAGFNQQLFRQRQGGRHLAQINAGLLLMQNAEAQFLQAGAIGLLRYQQGGVHRLVGVEGLQLGAQPELALVQHSLVLSPGELLLLAPQPLLDVADLQGFRRMDEPLPELIAPLLQAPGAAALVRLVDADNTPVLAPPAPWPVVVNAQPGQQLDGWTLLSACPFGPPGRVFRATDPRGREAMLWLAEQAADEVFRQREWALRRSPVASLPQVMSAHQPRSHAFLLFEPVSKGMRSLVDWLAAHGALDGVTVLALLDQLIVAVRGLQRRGMQGLWLDPRSILVDDAGRVVLLPEYAALLPGVPPQPLPEQAVPLAPEARSGQALDGRADQFALAALAYWLIGRRWPEAAQVDADHTSRYVPLAQFNVRVPAGWDGVLARALAPKPQARFEALSAFQYALQQPLRQQLTAASRPRHYRQPWHLAALSLLVVQLVVGLWLSLEG
ncbi:MULTISPECIES: serine/threonine-protein kinase [Pseudomonas]|uniref:SpoIIE family protein phosphatase n=1 Tax=Pseudomonas spirodelae TaxID=3101751 RepID=A0ABU5PDT6_9PSED|nr:MULTISPECIES: SpoIIE family protein phosphatase [unclassified Pseudomonas]MBU0809046.1 SpoIIE family protein phosphatase [Gammaproteobacteria bacterium]MBU0883865.1 SpoIIE family protein phosphatase [Gammaproteobacteria bacterium]MBU1858492.1 SpoIIE family protein phosphatase [Gammaproteobacteria bacterium]MDD2159260.1 SpoIIE family protein phosphatase [Pseudomonas sp. MIL19]MEA1607761.1 SpoIIE family protein phosphatase [Pseudomonas sp. T5W1]